ncbi:ClpP/crotonase-like domain-containing protein [Pavlovales sp. CCMP2436]|nr:ClpP/crotonase-like domain-containing protein [Pavlovales sp. CCMP2436]
MLFIGRFRFSSQVIQAGTDGTVSMGLQHPASDGDDAAAASQFSVKLKRAYTVTASPVLSKVVRVGSGERALDVGYVKLAEFNSVGARQVGDALRSMAERKVGGYVLDLRGNRGGVLEGALEIGGFFMGKGVPVVNVIDGFGAKTVYAATEEALVPAGAPVAVLVDSGSASASEVLAGALRDRCRATIIGERTYGKGVIQGVFGMRNGGAVILTLAKYQSPAGTEINGIGVLPNVDTWLKSTSLPPLLDGDIDFAVHAAQDSAGQACSTSP